MKNRHVPHGPYERWFKRPLDFIVALLALIVLSPVLLVTAILVRVKLGGPVIFRQARPGRNGKIFHLYKFRTMTDGRDAAGNLLPDDQRLTAFGQKLRFTSLDELPELVNILRGDLSIVGPRPLLVQYLPYYNEEEQHRHAVRPGLTGYAQVHGRNTVRWEERFAMDVQYARSISFKGDLTILFQTVASVVKHSDIVAPGVLEDFDEYRKKQLSGKHSDSDDRIFNRK